MYSGMLDTFQKSRTDRIEEMRANMDREAHRDKFKKKKASKKIGKSEKVHAKNKPFMMVKKKKIQELREKLSAKPIKRKQKRQLGHFKKATAQRIEAKKMGRK